MQKPQIILASASLGRRTLLEKLGVHFTIMPSEVDEDKITDSDPRQMILNRARAKADDILKKLSVASYQLSETGTPVHPSHNPQPTTGNFLIIAADSMAILDHKTFGKVRNREETKQMIKTLMGRTHDFVTATSIIYFSSPKQPKSPIVKRWDTITTTEVTIRNLNPQEIEEYTRLYDFRRFAAAYTLNETPYDLITKINGSYTNVIGLPFEVLLPILRKLKLI